MLPPQKSAALPPFLRLRTADRKFRAAARPGRS